MRPAPTKVLDHPLGVGGKALHEWLFATRMFQVIHGREGGVTGVDDDFAARGFADIGAWIIGRNMFGPSAENGPTSSGKAGGANNPPYHVPVFVSAITRANRSRWRGGRHFISSRTASRLR